MTTCLCMFQDKSAPQQIAEICGSQWDEMVHRFFIMKNNIKNIISSTFSSG